MKRSSLTVVIAVADVEARRQNHDNLRDNRLRPDGTVSPIGVVGITRGHDVHDRKTSSTHPRDVVAGQR
jgi:hypothetical protein